MTENKRYRVFKYPDCEEYGVSDDVAEYTLARFDNHFEAEGLCELLNELNDKNDQLKKELQRMYDVATLNKAIEVLENKYDEMLFDGSDEIKDAMRHTVLRCIEDLDELKDDITVR